MQYCNFQQLCRHVIRNQHKLMRILQQQIRLCTGTARPQQKLIEDESIKLIEIPPSAYEINSHKIEHEIDNGNLFKVFPF